MELKCKRCGHEWITKTENKPKVCPSCKSKVYEKPLDAYWSAMRKKWKKKGSE